MARGTWRVACGAWRVQRVNAGAALTLHGPQAGGGEIAGGVLGEAGGEVGGAEAGDPDGVGGRAAQAEPPRAGFRVLDVDDLHVLDAKQLLHSRGLRTPCTWTRGVQGRIRRKRLDVYVSFFLRVVISPRTINCIFFVFFFSLSLCFLCQSLSYLFQRKDLYVETVVSWVFVLFICLLVFFFFFFFCFFFFLPACTFSQFFSFVKSVSRAPCYGPRIHICQKRSTYLTKQFMAKPSQHLRHNT